MLIFHHISIRSETYHMHYCTKRGSLGYLDCETPIDKDNELSLCTKEEFWICVSFIFEEMKKMIFKNITMHFKHVIFFSCPTNNSRWDPTKDLIGCESFICCKDERVMQVVRRIQCFIRLGMILRSGRVCDAWARRIAKCQAQYKDWDIYKVNELSF